VRSPKPYGESAAPSSGSPWASSYEVGHVYRSGPRPAAHAGPVQRRPGERGAQLRAVACSSASTPRASTPRPPPLASSPALRSWTVPGPWGSHRCSSSRVHCTRTGLPSAFERTTASVAAVVVVGAEGARSSRRPRTASRGPARARSRAASRRSSAGPAGTGSPTTRWRCRPPRPRRRSSGRIMPWFSNGVWYVAVSVWAAAASAAAASPPVRLHAVLGGQRPQRRVHAVARRQLAPVRPGDLERLRAPDRVPLALRHHGHEVGLPDTRAPATCGVKPPTDTTVEPIPFGWTTRACSMPDT